MCKLLQVRPTAVVELRDVIFRCLEDGDISIRARALDIISGMVGPSNIFGVVKHLLVHLASTRDILNAISEECQDRTLVAKRIIEACSKDTYININNFEWYISVLIDLMNCQGVSVGTLICEQLIDICLRVKEVRSYAVHAMVFKSSYNSSRFYLNLKVRSSR